MQMKDNDSSLLKIRVKPYVYKYFLKHFYISSSVPGTIRLPAEDSIWAAIRKRLKKPRNLRTSRIRERMEKRESAGKEALMYRTCQLYVSLSDSQRCRHGSQLTESDEAIVATLMEQRIRREMVEWVNVRYMVYGKLWELCREWAEKHGITEEDWAVQTMCKHCTRKKSFLAKKEYGEYMNEAIALLCERAAARKRKMEKSEVMEDVDG